ncbi:hypothetical protein [Deinococcus multiflagellatus]|uniref:Uncharacterized protein n=1 Tax=Deinococcus multiflagellatus TaxID=1656887 RepID=A0ABW1ZTT0_9DEIO|nr:hypothetical protein [Deinococcus multiflagellatus]MBZ9715487.1 hypothetical protein [Deinococcus multiflagellatus]
MEADQHKLLVRGGPASQTMFRRKMKSYLFGAITSIKVSASALIGRIQIIVPGSSEGSDRSAGPAVTEQMENVDYISLPRSPEARAIANSLKRKLPPSSL